MKGKFRTAANRQSKPIESGEQPTSKMVTKFHPDSIVESLPEDVMAEDSHNNEKLIFV